MCWCVRVAKRPIEATKPTCHLDTGHARHRERNTNNARTHCACVCPMPMSLVTFWSPSRHSTSRQCRLCHCPLTAACCQSCLQPAAAIGVNVSPMRVRFTASNDKPNMFRGFYALLRASSRTHTHALWHMHSKSISIHVHFPLSTFNFSLLPLPLLLLLPEIIQSM